MIQLMAILLGAVSMTTFKMVQSQSGVVSTLSGGYGDTLQWPGPMMSDGYGDTLQ